MTIKELSQLYYLKREIDMDKQRLNDLRQIAASPSTPNLSGMPRGSQSECALERKNIKIFELEKLIEQKIDRCNAEKIRLEKYIENIDDSLTRQIFTQRFIRCLSWRQVAHKVGGYNTAETVRQHCYRYLKNENLSQMSQIDVV